LSVEVAVLAERAGAIALRAAIGRLKSMPLFIPGTVGGPGFFLRPRPRAPATTTPGIGGQAAGGGQGTTGSGVGIEKAPAATGGVAANSGETAATAAGRAAHKSWQPPSGFQKEFRLPSGRRADAANPTTREVIELKPNNPRAIREGQRQVESYVKELEEFTGQKWTGRVETYP
jgi:restriction endonuclease fold toxin 9 of polymorphic toxin system